MATIDEWKDLTLESIKTIGEKIGSTLPKITGVVLVLLLGWLLTKLVLIVLKKLLIILKVDRFGEKVNNLEMMGGRKLPIKFSQVLLGFAKWSIYLMLFIVASDIMEWKIISNEIGNLLRYLPKLFSGIILFIVGMYIANIVRRAISTLFSTLNLNGSRLIGMAIFYLIAIFFTISALNQAGVDTTIITNNITMILGAFLLALAIGFGFGSKEVIASLLLTFYARKKYRVGDIIEIDGLEGKIESLDNMGVTLAIKNERIIFPIKEVTEKRIIVKKRFVS